MSKAEEFTRKVVGLMTASAMRPLEIIGDDPVEFRCNDNVLGKISRRRFDKLSVYTLLRKMDIPINPITGTEAAGGKVEEVE